MPLTLNSTGGGSVTLDSGSTPNNVTITLPGTAGTMATLASVTNNGVVYVNSSGQPTSGSGLVFDSSGNLGLGVTPSAWSSSFKVIQLGPLGGGTVTNSAIGQVGLGANNYQSAGVNYYAANGYSTIYNQVSGYHRWFTAPSGTAGNAISFTQAMTLDTSGNLGIGTSSPAYALDVSSQARIGNGANQALLRLNGGSSGNNLGAAIYFQNAGATNNGIGNYSAIMGGAFNADLLHYVGSANNQIFFTSGSERMRITDAGEVWIAGTTDRGAYNLQCNGTGVWGAGAYVNGSDARLKEEVADIDSGLDVVAAMRPVTYRYKLDYSKDQSTQPGFIAQELQQALAATNYVDGVVQAGPEYLNVAYQNLIPILTKAIQELKAELDAAKTEINSLKAKVQ